MAQAAAARSLEQRQVLLEGGEVPDVEVESRHEGTQTAGEVPRGCLHLTHIARTSCIRGAKQPH